MCITTRVLTGIEAQPDPGPKSHGPFSQRKCQLETGNLYETENPRGGGKKTGIEFSQLMIDRKQQFSLPVKRCGSL